MALQLNLCIYSGCGVLKAAISLSYTTAWFKLHVAKLHTKHTSFKVATTSSMKPLIIGPAMGDHYYRLVPIYSVCTAILILLS